MSGPALVPALGLLLEALLARQWVQVLELMSEEPLALQWGPE
jgi:hypothetical protein